MLRIRLKSFGSFFFFVPPVDVTTTTYWPEKHEQMRMTENSLSKASCDINNVSGYVHRQSTVIQCLAMQVRPPARQAHSQEPAFSWCDAATRVLENGGGPR